MSSDDDWKKKLTKKQYHIMREKGTEPPFSGRFVKHKEDGTYVCAACDSPLFDSDTKFESGTGWPSFTDAIEGSVEMKKDYTHGMERTEVICAKCGGHLGHVFDERGGRRFCVNSAALGFEPEKAEKE